MIPNLRRWQAQIQDGPAIEGRTAAVCRVVQRGHIVLEDEDEHITRVVLDLSLVRVGRQWRNPEVYRTGRSRTIPHDVAVKLNLRQVTVCPLRPAEHQVGDEPVYRFVVCDRDLHLLVLDLTFRDCQVAAGCRGRARAGLCRRVVQHCWVRRDAPLPGRTRVRVRRRVVARDRVVVEVEADIGQVHLLERHKVRIVEVPAVDVPRELRLEVRATDRDDGVLWVGVHGGPRVGGRQRVLTPLTRGGGVGLDARRGIICEATIDRRRVGQQVGTIGAGAVPYRLDATREVRRARPDLPRALHPV